MSLPTYLQVCDNSDNVLKRWFFNPGWTCDGDSLYAALKDLRSREPDAMAYLYLEDYDHVRLYQMHIPRPTVLLLLTSKPDTAKNTLNQLIIDSIKPTKKQPQ